MARHVLASLFIVSTALFSSVARAQEPPPDAPPPPNAAPANTDAPRSDDLAEFTAFLERSDDPTRTYRLVGGLVGLGVGGLVIPVGASMYSRDPGVGAGVTIGVGIGTAVSGALVLMGSTRRPYRDAADAVAHEKALGRSDAVALAAGEHELARAAAEQHLERLVGGGVFLGLSVIALGLGTTFAAADLTSESFDRHEQDGVAAALLVGGALGTAGAVEILFSPMADEMAWEGYAAGRRVSAPRVTSFQPQARLRRYLGPAPERRASPLVPRGDGRRWRFGVSPLPEGGARVGLGGRF